MRRSCSRTRRWRPHPRFGLLPTLLRYQLFVPPGFPAPARLSAYPFPLVGAHGAAPARMGLVLPDPPNTAELAAGFRLVADLGRLSAGQQVAPEAVTTGQLDWLRAGGLPALITGSRPASA